MNVKKQQDRRVQVRAAYRPPAIIEEQVFERQALQVCNKFDGQAPCLIGGRTPSAS